MSRLTLFVAAVVPLAAACKHPEAPAELDELCGYLFDNMGNDDPEHLQVGLANLDIWLDARIDETSEGYTIQNLSQESVDSLDDQARPLQGLVGAAVGAESRHSVQDNTLALTWEKQTEVYPDEYESYDRQYPGGDLDCFLAHDCEMVEAQSVTTASYAGILTITTDIASQYRWIETDDGTAMVYRTWLQGPAEVNLDWLDLDSQYYVGVNLPRGDQGDQTVRLMATWMVATLSDSSVDSNFALNLVINSLTKGAGEVDDWLDER